MNVAADALLRSYGAPSLQQMARQCGIDPKGKNKESLIQLLARDLYDGKRIQRLLDTLTPLERRLVDALQIAGGDAPTAMLRSRLDGAGTSAAGSAGSSAGRQDPERWGSYRDHRGTLTTRTSKKFEDVVAWLSALRLVFTVGPGTGSFGTMSEVGSPGARLYIPDGILRHLPPASLPVEAAPAPAVELPADPGAILRDVYALLAFADRQPIALTTRGQIAKRTLVQLNDTLQVPEEVASARSEDDLHRLPFLRALVEQAALLAARLGTLVVADDIERYLSQPPGERLLPLYRAYCQTPRWHELFHAEGLAITFKGGGRQATGGVIEARRRVLAQLAELPAETWVPLAHLVDRMKQRAFEFLLPRQGSAESAYYYSSYGYTPNLYHGGNALGLAFDGVKTEDEGWDAVEGGFIRTVVTRALHWLGAIDLGRSEGARAPTVFRVTAAGARLLHDQAPAMARPPSQVVIQPNFQILAFKPTGEDVLFRLDRLAERVRAEQVVEYRLTRDSVYRAQRGGLDTPAIVAFLEEVSAKPLPQNVRRTLEGWGADLERIVVHRSVAALETADASTLDAIAADANGTLGRRLAPTLAFIPPANLATVYRKLLDRGRLPALTEGNADPRAHQFAVDPDGRVTFRHRVPSLFMRHTLRQFADEVPPAPADSAGSADGGAVGGAGTALLLTAASLQRAARDGLDAEAVIARLQRGHTGPLPPEVQALVRRWTKDWGRGALVDVTLLQVENAAALAELLADAEIGSHLTPIAGAPTLAAVAPAAAPRVRAALQGRGMALDDRLAAP